jgi:cellulose synthase operon protein C
MYVEAQQPQAKSRAEAKSPADLETRMNAAQDSLANGRVADAIDEYVRARAIYPSNGRIELGLADAYRRVHNDEEAKKILEMARREHPRSLPVLMALGSLDMDDRKYDDAISLLKTAMQIAPDNSDAGNLLASAYLKKGDSQHAQEEFDKVLQRDPGNSGARFMRAQLLVDAGENEKAASDVELVLKKKPGYEPAQILYAKLLTRLRRCDQAVQVLGQIDQPAHQADSEFQFLLASAFECAGKKDAAEETRAKFEAASRAEHETSENKVQSLHLVEQANSLAMRNQFTEAQNALAEALKKNPDNAFAYSQQAKIFFSIHQPEKAREAVDKAIQLQPYQPDFLFVRGVIEAGAGESDAALASFRAATLVNPDEADAYFEIGKIWMQKGDRGQALAAFKKASALAPDDNDYRDAVKAASSPAK